MFCSLPSPFVLKLLPPWVASLLMDPTLSAVSPILGVSRGVSTCVTIPTVRPQELWFLVACPTPVLEPLHNFSTSRANRMVVIRSRGSCSRTWSTTSSWSPAMKYPRICSSGTLDVYPTSISNSLTYSFTVPACLMVDSLS